MIKRYSINSEHTNTCTKICKETFLIISQLDAPISKIYYWNETLHVSDSSSVHHHEFFTVHTAKVYVPQVC